MNRYCLIQRLASFVIIASFAPTLQGQTVVVEGDLIYTMAGPAIENGVILVVDGKIAAVGRQGTVPIPEDATVFNAAVVTPGLIDGHSVVGLGGFLNQDEDQDQLENSSPIQPGLRALDAYNGQDELVAWMRSLGVTTVHTGHAPGQLVSGQTMVVKTMGTTVEEAVIHPVRSIAATFSSSAQQSGASAPGTRGKVYAMLRAELIKTQEYLAKRAAAEDDSLPPRDLELEALGSVLTGEIPLMITADRAQDIASVIRIKEEFEIEVWLDSGAESYLLTDELKHAEIPVLIHPQMARPVGDRENLSFETAAHLINAGIPVVIQSGYEGYVPKTRIVLFEAAIAAANGLTFEQALSAITIDAARLLGVADRVGSLAEGKDADIAMFDGDPFEYTTHCIGVLIDGNLVSDQTR